LENEDILNIQFKNKSKSEDEEFKKIVIDIKTFIFQRFGYEE